MAQRVFIHIGLPKTATTYLQTILWASRPQLAREGVLLPGRGRSDHLWSSRIVRDDPRMPRRPAEQQAAWDRIVAEIEQHPGDALITHEFFAAASTDQARRMVARLAPAQVHVLVTARETLGLFTASWQESIKNRGVERIEDYSREVSDDPGRIWNWRTLDLRLVLERWSAAVPHERVHVLPLDPTAPRDDIWHRFARTLGLDPGAYDLSQSFPNESMGVVEAEVLRRVNEHLVARRSMRSAWDRGVFIRTFLADERLVARAGEKFWPPADRVEECRRRADEVVAYLVQHPFDIVGDATHLRVPDHLPERRVPGSVTDAEVATVATDLVAVLLDDVKHLRQAAPRAGAQRSLVERLRSRLLGR